MAEVQDYLDIMALMQDEPAIPEGFAVILSKRITLLGSASYFLKTLEQDFYFEFKELRANWIAPAGASRPAIEIMRSVGERAYQQGNLGDNAVELGLYATPGEHAAGTVNLKAAIPMNKIYTPGEVLTMKVSGYLAADAIVLDLTAIGRYVLKPELR